MARKPVLPPTYFTFSAFVSIALHFAFPVVSLFAFPFNLVGLVPIALGSVLNVWADSLFKKRHTTVKPFEQSTVLITGGPFAWSRHPMYLGMVNILLGISLICGSLASFVGPLLFWMVIRLRFIPSEERSLLETYGDKYCEYARSVHSWV